MSVRRALAQRARRPGRFCVPYTCALLVLLKYVPVPQHLLSFLLQPLSPTSQRRLKQLTDKHGSAKIYQMMSAAVGSRDLDLSLGKGELVAVVSEADSRGDRRRWLVDAGGENQ